MTSKSIGLIVAAAVLASGCAGYDQWAENTNKQMNTGWTEMLHGKQAVETSGLPQGFNITIRYGKGEGVGLPGRASSRFYDKLLGDMSYTRSCPNMLSATVALHNSAGGLVRTETIMAPPPYSAGTKVPINKDVITDPMMSKSSQVTKLVVSNVRCI